MKKLILLFAALLVLPAGAAPNPADFNVQFTVTAAYMPASGGCFMTFKTGNAAYDVVNSGFKHCHIFSPGAVLTGRFHTYGKQGIEIYAPDETGKLKVLWCIIQSTTFLPLPQ